MENLNYAVRKEGALRGVLFGGLMLFVDILKLYYLANVAGSPLVTFIVLYPIYYIVLFAAAMFFISALRNKIGRYWSLKQATTGIFIMLFITGVIWNNGLNLFAAKINPALAARAHIGLVNARKAAMVSRNLPAAKINTEVANMNKAFNTDSQLTIGNFVKSLFVSAILVFAVSALLGALFKREQPVPAP
jgi:hypothetical protein